MPEEERIEVNYLRLGDKVFAVKEINNPAIDINEELRQLYNNRIDAHVDQYNEGVVENVVQEWTTQYDHISDRQNRGDVKVPSTLFDKPVIVKNGRVLECRAILYSPCQMLGTLDMFAYRCQLSLDDANLAKFRELDGATRSTDIYIDIAPSVFLPLIVAYDPSISKLYTINMRTFHSYSDGRICTGNHSAEDFWNAPNFEELINHVNWHSPATDTIRYGEIRIKLKDMLTNASITGFRRRGDSEWIIS